MLFWTLTIVLALGVAFGLARGWLRGRARGETGAAAFDLSVYRDQLRDLDRDLARGVITAPDADRMRNDIARKVLEADRALGAPSSGSSSGLQASAGGAPAAFGWPAAALAALVLAGSFVLYASLGAPGYDDQPIAARLEQSRALYDARPSQAEAQAQAAARQAPQPAPDPQLAELMARLREAVAQRPSDREGLRLLVRNEAGLGNLPAAWAAQAQLIAALGDEVRAPDYAAQAELMILAAGGRVTPEAESLLAQALDRDPAEPSARYYLGLMMAQSGRPDRTFGLWRGLLEEGPEEAPWIAPIRDSIADLAWLAGEETYVPPPVNRDARRGPSAEDMQAAAQMDPAARADFIRSMVDGLAARLANEGGPAQDWARLIAALGVLGDTERARAIWNEAENRFAGSPDDLQLVANAARQAGVLQ